eukprot:1857509-Rhodomonas_salina.1
MHDDGSRVVCGRKQSCLFWDQYRRVLLFMGATLKAAAVYGSKITRNAAVCGSNTIRNAAVYRSNIMRNAAVYGGGADGFGVCGTACAVALAQQERSAAAAAEKGGEKRA